MRRANDLGKDPIWSLVLKLSIPSMIAQFVNVLYSIIDRMYIGNIHAIGELALAGVGICGPIVTLLSSFGTLVGLGGSILMAMKMGEGNRKEAKHILSNSFLMLTVLSLILTVIFLLFKNKLLFWFGASNVTFEYANTYMTIYTLGTFFALMAVGLNYFITCQGFPTISMFTVLLGTVTNIILDPIFIFVLNMGVAGAAIATVIAQIFSCSFALWFLFGKTIPIKITFGNYSKKIMKGIVKIGVSPFLILASDSIIIILMNAILKHYGGKNGDMLISCATIVQSYLMLVTGPMLGITGGTQAIISYNYGAQNHDRVLKAEKYILILCASFTTIMFAISRIIPQYFVEIFTKEPEYISLSVWGIKAFTLGIIPLAAQYTFVDGLTALGCTKAALCLSMFRKSVYVISTFFLPMFFATRNVFYAQPIADMISTVVSTVTYLLLFKKHLYRKSY
ncbi:putative efflux protein, MATE family [Hathewaya proteolytica DSM 3090]|uniref:Multidrug export protein MepA n=1 Tax=Hathewaya proteolytica DSM 3090 TaxID=1121331 RepID=A0A1M6KDB0_9CLOT|nr:MATE family efflux transporter [Hathewaya proteolytica]SHJ56925.1 putative efflux protein, MATE family [Hathewaya proteolytica DSM 3090]